MLSVLPQRIEDESLISYVLRLTQRNGFHSPLDWLSEGEFKAIVRSDVRYKHYIQLRKLFPLTEQDIQVKPNTRYSALFLRHEAERPRLCSRCIADTGYLKAPWRTIDYIYCERHEHYLIDVCPHCGEELHWAVPLLDNMCPNEMCARKLKSPPLDGTLSNLFIDEICDCLLAENFFVMPYQTYLTHHTYPQFKNFSETVKTGMKVLTQRDMYMNLMKSLSGQENPFSRLPSRYRYFPLKLLMNYLNAEWPLSKWASASLASIREERHQPVDIDKFIVTVEDAVNLLHISRSTLISTIPELATKRVIPKGMRINAIDLIVNAKK